MAFLKQTLTLSTAGASLIASNSFWFFDFFGIYPIQDNSMSEQIEISTTSNPSQAIEHTSSKKATEDMNKFMSAPKHSDIKGSTLINAKLKTGSVFLDFGFDFTLENLTENKNKYMSRITSETLGDFTLSLFVATEQDYLNFSMDQIKIKLFKNPAWYSSTEEDEYSQDLEKSKIEELFKGQDEAKVKQLLLSLNKGLTWKKFGYDENEKRTKFQSELFYSSKLDDLKNLKIKYFSDFASLKDYVHKKVTTCKEEKIACIADKDELNIMDTDQPSFFEKVKNANNT